MLRLVGQNPGAHLREFERLSPLSLGSLRHHLDELARRGLVRVERDLRFKRYFVADVAPLPRRAAIAARQAPLRRVLEALLATPAQRHAELAQALALPRPSLTTYLRRLSSLGLVTADAAGRYAVADPDAVRVAIAAPPGFVDRLVERALELLEQTEGS